MHYMITYQKNNGDIFFRRRKTLYNMRVGDETSMGWTILNIHYFYEGNYYNYSDYCKVVKGKTIKPKREKKFIRYLINKLNKLL